MNPTNDEIRRAIARAKGWKVVFRRDFDVAFPPEYEVDTFEVVDGWKVKDLRWATGARWVEDIAAAWELFGEFPNPSIERLEHLDGKKWRVWYDDDSVQAQVAIDDPTASRAICLAWLAWKGIAL